MKRISNQYKEQVDVYRVRFKNGRVVAARVPFNSPIPETHAKVAARKALEARGEDVKALGEPVSVEFVRREDRVPPGIRSCRCSAEGPVSVRCPSNH